MVKVVIVMEFEKGHGYKPGNVHLLPCSSSVFFLPRMQYDINHEVERIMIVLIGPYLAVQEL